MDDGADPVLRVPELFGHGGDTKLLIQPPNNLPVQAFHATGARAIALFDLGGGEVRGKHERSGHGRNLLRMRLLLLSPLLSIRIPYYSFR
jgi:hypothetical protein